MNEVKLANGGNNFLFSGVRWHVWKMA